MAKKREIWLEYQNYFDLPPEAPASMYKHATGADDVTMKMWKDIWIKQIKANKVTYGSFADKSIGKFYKAHSLQPMVIAGSGPSLQENGHLLAARGNIKLISCLHNFHFFEDLGIAPDYYVTLDAGPVTIEEVSEGGKKTEAEYWEITKDRVLLAFIGTHPDLLAKWQGEIYFFNCLLPNDEINDEIDSIERFRSISGTGGNVLGASFYISKAIMGSCPSIFVGVNYSFSYDSKFHAWDSKYDANIGRCVPLVDIYGNRVKAWPSYTGFKSWHEYICEVVPGIYINASEGGCLGSYPEGNIRSIRQMDLKDALNMFHLSDHLELQFKDPSAEQRRKLLF